LVYVDNNSKLLDGLKKLYRIQNNDSKFEFLDLDQKNLLDLLVNLIVKREVLKRIIKDETIKKFPHIQITKSMVRKLVYLYFRIKNKIPTILIGETGVGKTILIKLLTVLMSVETEDEIADHNIKLRENISTIDIHPGIT